MRHRIAMTTALLASLVVACDQDATTDDAQRLEAFEAAAEQVEANLALFDDLDFRVFTKQEWQDLHQSHAQDVLVHWPDGHTTVGIDQHIDDLSAMFVWAPDTRIEDHPIRVGQGDWTAVIGTIEGTFTEPMPIGDGQFIEPTGKAYKLTMATFSHWPEGGPMDEEYLFWDNAEFYRQLGLSQ